MPSEDRVNTPSRYFLDCIPGAVTFIDLAYEEYVARGQDGAATAHVEAYWSWRSSTETDDCG